MLIYSSQPKQSTGYGIFTIPYFGYKLNCDFGFGSLRITHPFIVAPQLHTFFYWKSLALKPYSVMVGLRFKILPNPIIHKSGPQTSCFWKTPSLWGLSAWKTESNPLQNQTVVNGWNPRAMTGVMIRSPILLCIDILHVSLLCRNMFRITYK